jgi:signal transduction histidine kinase
LASNVFEELQRNLDRTKVSFQLQDNAITTGDEILLRLVLQKLIDNAIKFSQNSDVSIIEFFIGLWGRRHTRFLCEGQ